MALLPETSFLPELISIYALYLLAAMSPGPNLFVISGTALARTRAHGIGSALGVSTGTLIYTTATMLGLSAAVAQMSSLTTTIRLCGAAYLVYLGVQALMRALGGRSGDAPSSVRPARSVGSAYLAGLLTNLSNPKALVFYLSLMSLVVTPQTPSAVKVAGGAGIVILSLAWHSTVAWTFSQTRIHQGYRRAAGWIDGFIGASLIAAGSRIVLTTTE